MKQHKTWGRVAATLLGLSLSAGPALATTIMGTQVNVVAEGAAAQEHQCAQAAVGHCESWLELVPSPHRAFGYSRSDSSRVTDLSLDARGTATAIGVATWKEVLVNTTNQRQEVWLDFYINNGWISADAGPSGGSARGYFTVGMVVNDAPVYQLYVDYDSTATPGGDTDQLTDFVQKPAAVAWQATTIQDVYLGIIEPLGSLSVLYTMAAGATSQDGGLTGFTLADPDAASFCVAADGVEVLPGDANVECASAHVNGGDPGEFRFRFVPAAAAGTLPEPSSLALIASVLLGLVASRSRRFL